jgi:Domain of unknown function (DUF5666)
MDQFVLPRILLLGVTAMTLAACGGTTSAASGRPAAASTGAGGNAVAGQLAQLNGSRLVLSGQNGATNVTFDSSTRVQQTATGTLADIVSGACVSASGLKDASGSVTASTVTLTPKQLMNGTCTPAARNGVPSPGRSGGGGFPGNGNGNRASPPANFTFVRGEVASVSGTSVIVKVTGGGTQTLTVPSSARIVSIQQSSSSRLAVGQCIRASGQKDSSGTIKARTLSIQPAGPTGCFSGSGGFGPGGRQPGSPNPSTA